MIKRFLTMTILGTLVLPGCGKFVPKTVVLNPSQVATAVNRHWKFHKDAGASCSPKREHLSCYGRYGVLPDAPGDSPVAVGLWHDYAEADWFDVVGCWERINCIYRGLVMFDLTQLGPSPTVAFAKLKYQGTFDKRSDATQWSDEENCIAHVGYLRSPWGGFDLPWDSLGGDHLGFSGGKDVSAIVRIWLGTQAWENVETPNHGFILVGPKENISNNDDDTCVVTLSNLRLEVQLNVWGK